MRSLWFLGIGCLWCPLAGLATAAEPAEKPAKAARLDPTAFLPGPGGLPIEMPKHLRRILVQHRAAQAKQLAGSERHSYVIGLLETTHQPRETNVADLARAVATTLDLALLPVIILSGEPGIFTKNLGPPPPGWVRNDVPSIHHVRGREAALDLVYDFTTERLLDPPDPTILHRQRQWFLLLRTRNDEQAATFTQQAINSLRQRNPAFKHNGAAMAAGIVRPLDMPIPPELAKLHADMTVLLNDADKLDPAELTRRLRELNTRILAAGRE